MDDITPKDSSALLEEWKNAFVTIHKRNPRKADWLSKAPATVKRKLSIFEFTFRHNMLKVGIVKFPLVFVLNKLVVHNASITASIKV